MVVGKFRSCENAQEKSVEKKQKNFVISKTKNNFYSSKTNAMQNNLTKVKAIISLPFSPLKPINSS